MIGVARLVAIAAVFFLAGCAVLQPIAPSPEAPPNPAVVSLMEKARGEASAGQWDQASASLERALRIEPRNPGVWHELARVRLGQGEYLQAENLAAKSNAVAGGDRRLRAENWQLIGRSRSRRGDIRGAQAAFERADLER